MLVSFQVGAGQVDGLELDIPTIFNFSITTINFDVLKNINIPSPSQCR